MREIELLASLGVSALWNWRKDSIIKIMTP